MELDPERVAGWKRAGLVTAVAFCAGAQIPFLLQALTGRDYFATELPFKLGTLAVLVVGLYLLRPLPKPAAAKPAQSPAPAPRPAPPAPAAAPRTPTLPAGTRAPNVQLVLETPLSKGPVWPPGEPLPITVQVRGASAADLASIDVELELKHAGGSERARVALRESVAVLSQTVPQPGAFQVKARALWQGAVIAEAAVDGRAASYREEIGRRFDALKASSAAQGLAITQGSTPREVRDVLVRAQPQKRRSIDELLAALEVALFAEEEVGRDTYEQLVRALADIEQRGEEAAPRA